MIALCGLVAPDRSVSICRWWSTRVRGVLFFSCSTTALIFQYFHPNSSLTFLYLWLLYGFFYADSQMFTSPRASFLSLEVSLFGNWTGLSFGGLSSLDTILKLSSQVLHVLRRGAAMTTFTVPIKNSLVCFVFIYSQGSPRNEEGIMSIPAALPAQLQHNYVWNIARYFRWFATVSASPPSVRHGSVDYWILCSYIYFILVVHRWSVWHGCSM